MKTILKAAVVVALAAGPALAGPGMQRGPQPSATAAGGHTGIGAGGFSVSAVSGSAIGNIEGNGNFGTVTHTAGTQSAASIGIASTATASQTTARAGDGAVNGSLTTTNQAGTVTEMFGTAASTSFSRMEGTGLGTVGLEGAISAGSADAFGGFGAIGGGDNGARNATAFGGFN